MTTANAKVREWSERFRKDSLAAGVVKGLEKRSAEIFQHAFNLVQRESPEYRTAGIDPRTFSGISHLVTALRLLEAHTA
jgi:hypothetical protein